MKRDLRTLSDLSIQKSQESAGGFNQRQGRHYPLREVKETVEEQNVVAYDYISEVMLMKQSRDINNIRDLIFSAHTQMIAVCMCSAHSGNPFWMNV